MGGGLIGWNSAWLAMLAFIKHLQTKLRSARRSSTPGSVSLTPTIRSCADRTVCLIGRRWSCTKAGTAASIERGL